MDASQKATFCASLERDVGTDEVLLYVLSLLAAPVYRERFDAHLKLDYPRIPPPTGQARFDQCVKAGTKMRNWLLDQSGPGAMDPESAAGPRSEESAPRPIRGGAGGKGVSDVVRLGHRRVPEEHVRAYLEAMHACDGAWRELDTSRKG